MLPRGITVTYLARRQATEANRLFSIFAERHIGYVIVFMNRSTRCLAENRLRLPGLYDTGFEFPNA
jgi:hypothetical protein